MSAVSVQMEATGSTVAGPHDLGRFSSCGDVSSIGSLASTFLHGQLDSRSRLFLCAAPRRLYPDPNYQVHPFPGWWMGRKFRDLESMEVVARTTCPLLWL